MQKLSKKYHMNIRFHLREAALNRFVSICLSLPIHDHQSTNHIDIDLCGFTILSFSLSLFLSFFAYSADLAKEKQ